MLVWLQGEKSLSLMGGAVAAEAMEDLVYIALLVEEDHQGSRRVVEGLAIEGSPAAKKR